MKKIILTGCKRYNLGGELFLEKEIYQLAADKADYLLKQFDPSTGYNFFEQYHGAEEGKLTGSKIEDEHKHTEALGPKPQVRERKPRSERPDTCHPSVFKDLPKDRVFTFDKDSVPNAGSTVMLTAIPLLKSMGMQHCSIFGFDSCITDQHHAYSQPENDADKILEFDIDGRGFRATQWMKFVNGGNLNLSSDVLKLMLTNTAPVATNAVYADVSGTEIASGNGYTTGGATVTSPTSTNASGVQTVSGTIANPTWTATGAMATFRYVILYDTTASGSPLLGWWDNGSAVSLTTGQTFTVTASSGFFTLS
ncbi:unnamed protein product [Sphagnum balticum]